MSTTFTITDSGCLSTTAVSDVFINEYMPQANGEFVKIYLYLLHVTQYRQQQVSLSSIADIFACTEKDVIRALRYWEKQKLLALSFDEKKELTGLSLLPCLDEASQAGQTVQTVSDPRQSTQVLPDSRQISPDISDVRQAPQAALIAGQRSQADLATGQFTQTASVSDNLEASHFEADRDGSIRVPGNLPPVQEQKQKYLAPSEIRKMKNDNAEIGQLLFIAEQYLKKTLSSTDMQRVLYFYDELHFPAELIEYLIEYCVSQNHRSLSYIEKVGLSWHEEGIRTLDMARNRTSTWNKNYFLILKAFGIRGRDPIPTEVSYMNRWLTEYGFSMEVIREACARTIAQTSQPSFKYAEGILSKWHQGQVRKLDDIRVLDEQHSQRVKASSKKNTPAAANQSSNKFNNFHQRDYDFNDLEKQLLNH